jgi:hypothetical protein
MKKLIILGLMLIGCGGSSQTPKNCLNGYSEYCKPEIYPNQKFQEPYPRVNPNFEPRHRR